MVRSEHDLLGDRDLSDDAYYGIQTLRAVENYQVTDIPISHFPNFPIALAMVKKAAALANAELQLIPPDVGAAIVAAGKIGQGATFSHDDSYIKMPEPIAGGPTGDDAVTIAIWAFPTACGNRGLISYGDTGLRRHFYQRLEGSCKHASKK